MKGILTLKKSAVIAVVCLAALCVSGCSKPTPEQVAERKQKKALKGGEAMNVSYKVGDTGPGGGIVFYYSEVGFSVHGSDVLCHYLECSPTELGYIPWCPGAFTGWQNKFKGIGRGIGAGKGNTDIILRADHVAPLTLANCAAKACAEYSTKTTKTGEWYLPSNNELLLIYRNLKLSGKIVTNSYYWSSSVETFYTNIGGGQAYACNFNNGNIDFDGCLFNNVVRDVRAF
ncbi:MAG: hypothetical protein K2N58_07015 [Treponemataceae bacterium]|nr:hypothetical protein [Treponemataceae bacterium]